jgi:hypothetical protein
MKLHEIVTSKAVGSPKIPKRILKTIRRREVNTFLDFIRQFEDERKRKK